MGAYEAEIERIIRDSETRRRVAETATGEEQRGPGNADHSYEQRRNQRAARNILRRRLSK